MHKNLALSLGVAFVLFSGGCATSSRYVTAEHWHDDNSFFVGYTEYTSTNYMVTRTGSSSAHVMMCRVQEDNKADCRPQVAVDRLLNPDEKIPDPPPSAAESTSEAAPTGEPQS
ncbi:MAG TPA: hypothetical protein VF331_27375 [Polyangiales bacterium]